MRASTIGCDSSTRRPTAATILLMMRRRCASSLKGMCTFCSLPFRSTKQFSWPLIRMSLMSGSLSSGSSGPRPTISSTMSSTSASSSATLIAMRSSRVFSETKSWTCRRISSLGRRSSATRLISSSSMRWMRMRASSTRLLVFCAAPLLRRRRRDRLAGIGDEHAMIAGARRLGRLAGASARFCSVEKRLLTTPSSGTLASENSERDFCAAITSSGRMIFFRSLIDIGVRDRSRAAARRGRPPGAPAGSCWRRRRRNDRRGFPRRRPACTPFSKVRCSKRLTMTFGFTSLPAVS